MVGFPVDWGGFALDVRAVGALGGSPGAAVASDTKTAVVVSMATEGGDQTQTPQQKSDVPLSP